MKIFIDSANIDEIKSVLQVINGVTTNPSLIKEKVEALKKEGKKITMQKYIEEILRTAGKDRPVSLEVISNTENEMYKEAKKLFSSFNSIANNVVIKIPVNPSIDDSCKVSFDGIKTIERLSKEGIPVNATLILNPMQALIAAKAGAKYVSPFTGRIDDYLREKLKIKFNKDDYFDSEGIKDGNGKILDDEGILSGVDMIKRILRIFRNYDIKAEVLAASIRNTKQLREVAEVGAHIATVPHSVIKDALFHHKTFDGMKIFTRDVVPEYKELFS